jgi:hypothetical protein
MGGKHVGALLRRDVSAPGGVRVDFLEDDVDRHEHRTQARKNPYLTLSTAKALHGLELKFGYLRREHERRRQRQNPEAG